MTEILENDLLATAEYFKAELADAQIKLAAYEYLDDMAGEPELKAMKFALFRIMKDSECQMSKRLAEAALKGEPSE